MKSGVQMEIQGYSWAGTSTGDFAASTKFFGEVLGLPTLMTDEARQIAIFRLPSGQLFEVFGPTSDYFKLMRTPTIAFDVDDVEQARADLLDKGVEFVTEIEQGLEGVAWCYFSGPDGFLYEIWQRPRDDA